MSDAQTPQQLFDPAAYLDLTLTDPTEKRPPLPPGDYTAIIGEVTARKWQGKQDPTKQGIAWDIPLKIQVPSGFQDALKLPPEITLTDSCMLDLTPQGLFDNGVGKNRRVRTYREALDMNKPGDTFGPRQMQGRLVTVKVEHELYNGEPVERVRGVARAG